MKIDTTKTRAHISTRVPEEILKRLDEMAASRGEKRGTYLARLVISHVLSAKPKKVSNIPFEKEV